MRALIGHRKCNGFHIHMNAKDITSLADSTAFEHVFVGLLREARRMSPKTKGNRLGEDASSDPDNNLCSNILQ